MEGLPAEVTASNYSVGSSGLGGGSTPVDERKAMGVVEVAIEERTKLLTRIFQMRLRDEIIRMQRVHAAERKAHAAELRRLWRRCR